MIRVIQMESQSLNLARVEMRAQRSDVGRNHRIGGVRGLYKSRPRLELSVGQFME